MSTLEIIVAEDNGVQRMYLAGLIRKLGHKTIEAKNGQEAFEALISSHAPIVITDLQMPELDGIELTKKIRATMMDSYIHIIMLTSTRQEKERAMAQEAGVDDFLSKETDIASLRARINTAARLVSHEKKLVMQTLKLSNSLNSRSKSSLI